MLAGTYPADAKMLPDQPAAAPETPERVYPAQHLPLFDNQLTQSATAAAGQLRMERQLE